MGFRFQRRIGIGSFARINLSKSGVSLSVGPRGGHVTVGGTPRATVGIPGSGLSYTRALRARRSGSSGGEPRGVPVTIGTIFWYGVGGFIGLLFWLVVIHCYGG